MLSRMLSGFCQRAETQRKAEKGKLLCSHECSVDSASVLAVFGVRAVPPCARAGEGTEACGSRLDGLHEDVDYLAMHCVKVLRTPLAGTSIG